MLATPWPEPFDDEAWWFEVKWDGYRAIVARDGQLRVRSRRGLDLLTRFPELRDLKIPDGVVVDGEAVAFDDDGRPSFAALQAGRPVNLVVFDILYSGGDLTDLPYERRKEKLAELGLESPIIVPDPTPTAGKALFSAVVGAGMEGIVGKRLGSVYRPGRRSPDWRKISGKKRLRAVVGGYLAGTGGRSSTFGSLLLGLYDGSDLRWIGAVGSGFDDATLRAIHATVSGLETDSNPFSEPVTVPGKKTWVRPALVVEVEFKNWTADDHLRAPVFKGIDLTDPEMVRWDEERAGTV